MNRCKTRWIATGVLGATLALLVGVNPRARPSLSLADEPGGDPVDHRESEDQVDLDICDGQFGGVLAENQEDDARGAVTVADLNDSDGNDIADWDDNANAVKTTPTTLSANAAQGATTISVGSLNNFSVGNTIIIETASRADWDSATISAIDNNAKTLTLVLGLSKTYAAGSSVYVPEVDLMRIIVRKPSPDHGGAVILSAVSGNARVWERPTKEGTVGLPATIQTQQIDATTGKTLWVEAGGPIASAVRQIVLKAEYEGHYDIVKATAVWVRLTMRKETGELTQDLQGGRNVNPFRIRKDEHGWPDNPQAGGGTFGDLPDMDFATLVTSINETDVAYVAGAAGSRYGHGPFRHDATDPQHPGVFWGGRILCEFALLPPGAEALGLRLDLTRQAHSRAYAIVAGTGTVERILPDPNADFAWLATPPRNKEEPNDDGNVDDEDATPHNGLVPNQARCRPLRELAGAKTVWRS